jgi:hypothetical protein
VSATHLFHTLGTNPLYLKVAVLAPFKAKWVIVILIPFGVDCGCLIGQGTLTLEGIFHISHLSVRWFIFL